MHIIYLGSVVSKEEIGKLSGGSVAGNKMQWNILTELMKYPDVSMEIFSILSIAAFPRDRQLFVKKERKEISKGIYVTQIPFLNIPIIKQWMQSYKLYKYAKSVAKKNSIAFSFNLYMQEGRALIKLKKDGLKVVSLLADLPIDDKYDRKGIQKYLYKYFFECSKKNIKNCDNLIVLNKWAIKEYLSEANYIVVEGGADLTEYENLEENCIVRKKCILYSGALTEYSGIRELVLAMGHVKDKEVFLEIYGDGPLKEWVKEYEKEHRNVCYKGKVSNKEMIKKQKGAWLLVNPRPVGDAIARVTFPSKIFEYLLSGRPILCTKLTGLTEDYLHYMFVANDNSVSELSMWIDKIANMSEETLSRKGRAALEFVVQNKTWEKQVARIYQFLQSIQNEGKHEK